MDTERLIRIESEIESNGGVDNYVSGTYDSPEKVSDLSFYINMSIKSDIISKCDTCNVSDINKLSDILSPVLTLADAEKIIESRKNNTQLNKIELESYPSYDEIKIKMTSIPNDCIHCYKANTSNNNLNESRTCQNVYGYKDIPEEDAKFVCPAEYTNKSDSDTIDCPDQNNCTDELCCDVKDVKFYLKYILPAATLFCIIMCILIFVGYLLKSGNSNSHGILVL